MFLRALLATVFLLPTTPLAADVLRVPGLSDTAPPKLELPACANTGDQNNCARTLACIGGDGLWFDGQARGWNAGDIAGQMSNGVVCGGNWSYGGLFNTARAQITCEDGTKASLFYYAQDSLTGTGKARGYDNHGRSIRAWTGHNVLEFLRPEAGAKPELPCTDAPIPIS